MYVCMYVCTPPAPPAVVYDEERRLSYLREDPVRYGSHCWLAIVDQHTAARRTVPHTRVACAVEILLTYYKSL
jgi:hypothetical protein